MLGVEALELVDEVLRQALGRAHQQVVVEVVAVARGRHPAHLADLAGAALRLAVDVRRVGLGDVVVVAGLGGPLRGDLGVEGPEGHVDALHLLDAGLLLQVVRAEPQAVEPLAELGGRRLAVHLEGHQRLGREDLVGRGLGDDAGGAAERALARLLVRRHQHRRPAVVARVLLGRGAEPPGRRDVPEVDEVVLLDGRLAGLGRDVLLGAAVPALHPLLGGVVQELGPAVLAGKPQGVGGDGFRGYGGLAHCLMSSR